MHPMVPAAAPKCSARCACTAKVQRKCHGNGFGLSSRPAQGESCGGWRLRRGTARAGLRMPFHTTEGDGIGIDGLGDRREPQMASFQREICVHPLRQTIRCTDRRHRLRNVPTPVLQPFFSPNGYVNVCGNSDVIVNLRKWPTARNGMSRIELV